MPASITDKFRKVAAAFSTTLASDKAAGAPTCTLASTTSLPTDTAIDITVGRVDLNGNRTPLIKAVYTGLVSGVTITNLTLVEGTDQLHKTGTIVEITYTAATHNDAVVTILSQHKQDGTHSDITATSISVSGTVALPSASINQSALPLGSVVQVAKTLSTEVAIGTALIPADDTKPQITEGTEFMTCSITPKSITNRLVIEVVASVSTNNINNAIGALFQDANADALASNSVRISATDSNDNILLRHEMAAGTTGSTVFRFRASGQAPSTLTFNGSAGTRNFGATTKSSIIVTEYKA